MTEKILHISKDEKFIDMGLRAFERCSPHNNKLIVLSKKKTKHVTFENKQIIDRKNLESLSHNDEFWSGIQIVILHSLCTYRISIPKSVKVVWIGFGADYYDLITSPESLLGNKTKSIVSKDNPRTKQIIKAIRKFLTKAKKTRAQFINRIDYFCPVLTTEYNLIRWEGRKPKLIDWNYGTLEEDWAKPENGLDITGNNILLGNSATSTCNHIEGIDALKHTHTCSQLIIPLSYGDKEYAKKVRKYAEANYPGPVKALEEFMPFDSYNKLISSCSHVVMPHKRQQGLGNIVSLIYLGAKVFLDKENPSYNFFTEKGVNIFSIDEIENSTWSNQLTIGEIEENRRILKDIWGKDSIDSKTRQLLAI
ncbi:TDP-N-acetylfucosamine:lipid II N-acetylfucosaminyltransferase [Vibrio breoganii]|uniref:TDP-N-acetylfucosamine:lipid II N-acetylfucosaminyltransferase n=1 Tax=Vibrio breoganii TaxID=553239 RepID=UPI000C81ED14|nr:TDP-N-acetylfucosamine:lipid II N-acetylfucosaminyltransferase [Vibrio breoganii]PMG02434.1 hypothetical protein BCV02_11415 [Vibrio breoganii]PML95610.1 hypothetical protein BCT64_09225 [Vibrio breoganii]PMN64916.1 hypothetical protein BCT28_07280 [Vibrio breoganii]PMP04117.1 hypothetical protein BCS94_16700 [Vibrio breoganii]PMP05842.1 hypothetical protein BCS95_17935 [Vibrio breoganii]